MIRIYWTTSKTSTRQGATVVSSKATQIFPFYRTK